MLGKNAKGIRFAYSAIDKDLEQYGEMLVVKLKRRFYFAYGLARMSGKEESEALFASFVSSIKAL